MVFTESKHADGDRTWWSSNDSFLLLPDTVDLQREANFGAYAFCTPGVDLTPKTSTDGANDGKSQPCSVVEMILLGEWLEELVLRDTCR